jgi:hypothetical protein
MRHVMLDLETWGTRPGSALRSIGAIDFEPTGEIGTNGFYRNIDDQSCADAGLTIDPQTAAWWEKQSSESRQVISLDQLPLLSVIEEFHRWWRMQAAQFVWCQGANFDEPLWAAACFAVGCVVPWKYWDTRCTRTIYHAARFDPRSVHREGVHHKALDDAIFQARCVQESFRRLSGILQIDAIE